MEIAISRNGQTMIRERSRRLATVYLNAKGGLDARIEVTALDLADESQQIERAKKRIEQITGRRFSVLKVEHSFLVR